MAKETCKCGGKLELLAATNPIKQFGPVEFIAESTTFYECDSCYSTFRRDKTRINPLESYAECMPSVLTRAEIIFYARRLFGILTNDTEKMIKTASNLDLRLPYESKTDEEAKRMNTDELREYLMLRGARLIKTERMRTDPRICYCANGRLEILAQSLDKSSFLGGPTRRTVFYECDSCKALVRGDRMVDNSHTDGESRYPSRLTREEIINYTPKSQGEINEEEIIAKRK